MSKDRESVPVSLPATLVERLDELVEEDVFGSRSEALRYGARLVVREEQLFRERDESDPEPPTNDGPPGRSHGGGRSAHE